MCQDRSLTKPKCVISVLYLLLVKLVISLSSVIRKCKNCNLIRWELLFMKLALAIFPAVNSLLVWLISVVLLSFPAYPESCPADMTVMSCVVLCALSGYCAGNDLSQFFRKCFLFPNLLNNTMMFPHSSWPSLLQLLDTSYRNFLALKVSSLRADLWHLA